MAFSNQISDIKVFQLFQLTMIFPSFKCVQVSSLDVEIQNESDRHKVELESVAESHKRELMKLKATSAIATEALTSRASALESAVR